MSDSSYKFRFHMGCGEPLQSRWWVAQSVRTLLVMNKDTRAVQAPAPRTVVCQGAKCKS